MKIYSIILLILTVLLFPTYMQGQNTVTIQKSTIAPVIDGIISDSEWKDAKEIEFNNSTDNDFHVLVKYDAESLYIAFLNLTNSKKIRHNPEVLIHSNIENPVWDTNCYWFHASYSNCAAIGQYYFWEDCTMNPHDWNANTFPFKNDNNNIEFRISFAKLQVDPTENGEIHIAFKISNALEQHSYWPNNASIENPASWGFLQFKK